MELEILRWIQRFSSKGLDLLFLAITQLGEENVFVAVVTLVYWTINKKFGKVLGMALMVTLVVNNGLKELFSFQRPIGEEGIRSLRVETATGKSFPSGHTQTSTTFYSMIASNSRKKWMQIFCGLAIFMIGLSRLYLGVHYPKDVLAAWGIGLLITLAIYQVMKKEEQNRSLYLGVVILGLVILPFAQSSDYYKSLGLLLGFVLGLILEEKFAKFSLDVEVVEKVIRFAVGIILVLSIKIGLKVVLPVSLISDFIRYFMVSVIALGIYPILFSKVSRPKSV